MNLVKTIISTPEIWEQSAEDGVIKENFYPGYDALSVWLLCKLDNKIIGIIYVHNDTSCSINMHPYLIKKYKKYGREMMNKFFKWFLFQPAELIKLNISIPDHRQVVYNFAKKVGFKDEGINRSSFLKNGIVHDQYQMGLTRKEIEVLL